MLDHGLYFPYAAGLSSWVCPRPFARQAGAFPTQLTRPFNRSLSKDVFERRTSTGSEAFSLDSNKFVLLSFFSLIKRIYPRVRTKPLPNDAKSPLPVDVRRPKTLLLKLPTSTGSDAFSFLLYIDATKFVSLSIFNLVKTTCPKL